MTQTYSGFIAIMGPTNAGKSTLLNQIMGRKVSIVSHKVQTTRTRLRAVKMVGDRQLIFVDTPGVFKPARRLDRAMVGAAMDAASDAAHCCRIVRTGGIQRNLYDFGTEK